MVIKNGSSPKELVRFVTGGFISSKIETLKVLMCFYVFLSFVFERFA